MTSTGRLNITPRQSAATSGDDWSLLFQLWDGAAAKDVSGSTIKATLRNLAGDSVLASPVSQSSASTGAAWASGLVAIVIPAATTSALDGTEYLLEIQVTSAAGLITTWPWVPIDVARESITP